MPYSPPAGNAVVFDFTSGAYTPPTGNVVVFDFGSGGGGGVSGSFYPRIIMYLLPFFFAIAAQVARPPPN